mmetsp:Transcript_29373/g.57222  ORF Transcript_29373/g.57222 Transcript_29373/m.57222 type:complete len:130 (-) Transcript_29373:129-518(-)|eukprot:CAMPEP_0167810462 /NCGR_PEP_ID=MMETSP0112_2-20121227/98_1 /TAXON_ID=91324 /ORGANISM="Lotharella globosa, Strain CCCM811" /LENGTH=129 /DNA_ID=CAMNT_0007709009 /DNA_START=116 /DNA_END=505 /DNA_ORIENTATION=-
MSTENVETVPQEVEVEVQSTEKVKAAAERKGKAKAEDNTVRVSRLKRVVFYARRLKKMLETHDTVVLQGLGKAIMSTVELSQYLVHNMGCTIIKIQTANDLKLKKKKIMIEVSSGGKTLASPKSEDGGN